MEWYINENESAENIVIKALEYAKSKNVELIVGVEMSTKISKAGVHVLAYGIDYKNLELKGKNFCLSVYA